MRVISAGDGYRYLLKSVAAVDADRELSTPMTRYYAAAGTPPGFWLGSGLPGLAPSSGQAAEAVRSGEVVTDPQLRRLLGEGRHPVTGAPLGRAYPTYDRTAKASDGDAAGRKSSRRAVAGYDYTFSVPKSMSVLWALADARVQERIVAAHHAAVRDVLGLLEREVAATRTGALGADGGAVAQVDVHGVLATAFDHHDSRAGDPQLHTHVVISNKVQTVHDGKWRALDGRPMHAATVALSEHYNAVLADHLTRELGAGWEQRARGRDRNPGWDIVGIPAGLLEEFSTRSRDLETVKDRLIADYVDRHGHRPSAATVIKLRQQATLETRGDKQLRSLADLTAEWRHRATRVLGTDAASWTHELLEATRTTETIGAHGSAIAASVPRQPVQLVTSSALTDEDIAVVAKRVLSVVGEKRATWRYWNLHAEASRQTMGARFATTADRDTTVTRITETAAARSVRLTPDETAAAVLSDLRRADGTSPFRPRHGDLYTSTELLAAEDRLLAGSRATTGPAINPTTVARALGRKHGRGLGGDQRAAVAAVAGSGRQVDVFVGPAGTGKTTALRALRAIWETQHGPGSVVGLAPSAAGADVLGTELEVTAENTTKWLYDHTHHHTALAADQLVIIDEASLAGTHTLDSITAHAAAVGAKVLLVGDPAQLGAVDAGGAFSLLVDDRRHHNQEQDADDWTAGLAELVDVRRFHHPWERTASLALRDGDTSVVDTYMGHDRIHGGDTEAMTTAAYRAWKHDTDTGRTSLMVAETRDTVTDLNQRARADRIAAGHVNPHHHLRLADGTHASDGDVIVTRRNDRRLHAGRRWVRNGDRWHITGIRADGAVRARRLLQGGRLGPSVLLPAVYAATQVELGYAATVHRAQGATVDTAHLFVASSSMTREAFYVAMTRGRHSNTAYLATDQPDLEPHQQPPADAAEHVDGDSEEDVVRQVLTGILNHPGSETSARQQLQEEQDRWTSVAQLAAEYETLANHAQKPRWTRTLTAAGLTRQQADQIVESDAYGALATLLRRAEADGHDVDQLVPAAVARHRLDDVDDPAAILHHRISLATTRRPVTRTAGRRVPARIAGLIPQATGPITDEHRQALAERRHLIETRAAELLDAAITKHEPWLRALGHPPTDPHHRHTWRTAALTVVAYRDRHHIFDPHHPLGNEPSTKAQRADINLADRELNRAQRITRGEFDGPAAPSSRSRRGPDTPSM